MRSHFSEIFLQIIEYLMICSEKKRLDIFWDKRTGLIIIVTPGNFPGFPGFSPGSPGISPGFPGVLPDFPEFLPDFPEFSPELHGSYRKTQKFKLKILALKKR